MADPGDVKSDAPRLRSPIGPWLAFLIAPLVTFLLTVVAATLIGHRATMAYYQTVAFLVPSLLVTLALQGHFFRVVDVAPPPRPLAERHPRVARGWAIAERASAVALLLYLAAGELTALYVLATKRPAPLLFGVTAGAVITAFLALAVVALVGTPWAR